MNKGLPASFFFLYEAPDLSRLAARSMAFGTAPELAPWLGRPHRTISSLSNRRRRTLPRALSKAYRTVKPDCGALC